jgi:hypothetical protein
MKWMMASLQIRIITPAIATKAPKLAITVILSL